MAIKYSSVIGGSSAGADVVLAVTKANTMYEVTGLTGSASLYQINGTGSGSLFLEIWNAGSYITSIYQAYGTSVNITQSFDKLVFSSTAGGQNITLKVLPNVPTPITGATTLFTSSGTYSSTGYAYVVCIGGGGGGRPGTAYGYTNRYDYFYGVSGSSLGGQAGQYTLGYGVALSSNMTVTVGAGGGSNGNGGSSSFGGISGAVTTIPGIDAVTTSPKVSTARAISEALSGNYDTLSWAAGGSGGNVVSYGSAVSASGSAGGTGTLGTGGSGAYAASGSNTGYRQYGYYAYSAAGAAGTGIGAGGGAGSGAAAYNNASNGAGGSGTSGLVAITRFAS